MISLAEYAAAMIATARSPLYSLTVRQSALLMLVAGPGALPTHQCTVRGLAEHLRTSKPVITRAANALEDQGLLRRIADERDARSILLVPGIKTSAYMAKLARIVG